MDSSHFIGFQEQVEKVKHLRRTGWIVRGVPNPETVGAHSWRMAMMALQLSDKIEADGASVDRVICLCLMHDIAESVIGDIIPEEFQTGPKITAAVKRRRESEAVNFLSGNYSFPLFKSCFNEYEAGRTAAGKWAAELDKLDMVLQAYEYYERYPLINSLTEFMSFNEKRFQTPIGQAIIGEIKRRWYDGVCREGDEADKVKGLSFGADDYVTKPFSVPELMARIAALLRRVQPAPAQDNLHFGDIEMDFAKRRVTRGERAVHLGPTEFRLLQFLMEKPGDVLSRESLLKSVWGGSIHVELRTVDVHIRRLRRALNEGGEPDIIRTVRSAGYALDLNACEEDEEE